MAAQYSPLTQERIDELISSSKNPDFVREKLSNHFNGLERPVVVSIGIQEKISPDEIYNKLKENGIKVAKSEEINSVDISHFLVTPTGIGFPPMSPEEAVKAVSLVSDIFGDNIRGFALPKDSSSYCDYVCSNPEISREIDVNNIVKQSPELQDMLAQKSMSADQFIAAQLNSIDNLPKVDIHELNFLNRRKSTPSIFRGGTLGPKAFGIITSKKAKEFAYAADDPRTASMYSRGGIDFSSYKNVNNWDYGFIYQYKGDSQQKFYGNYDIENGRKGHILGVGGETYETLVLAHKNPLEKIYLERNGKVVCIMDENGNYASKEWEDFMKLHQPYAIITDRLAANRYKAERQALIDHEVYPLKVLDVSNTATTDNTKPSPTDELKLSGHIKSLEGIPLPKKLDLRECWDLEDLRGVDLSQCEEVLLPHMGCDLRGAKLPKKVKFNTAANVTYNLEGADLSQVENLELPYGTLNLKGIKFPPDMKKLNLSKCFRTDLRGADFSQFEEIKMPANYPLSINYIKLPPSIKKLDLSDCFQLNLTEADLSRFEEVKLPEKIRYFSDVKLPPSLKTLDLSDCENLSLENVDLSHIENLKLPPNYNTAKIPQENIARYPALKQAILNLNEPQNNTEQPSAATIISKFKHNIKIIDKGILERNPSQQNLQMYQTIIKTR